MLKPTHTVVARLEEENRYLRARLQRTRPRHRRHYTAVRKLPRQVDSPT